MNKRAIGTEGEQKAIQFLQKNLCNILKVNYVSRMGEIDIIAKEVETILFIEVKYRKDTKMGRPYESVNYHKQMKIIKSAMLFAQQNGLYEKPMRFDIIEIIDQEILWIKNAFTLENNMKLL